jgi:outer membrane receptor protein involved in Fe transport
MKSLALAVAATQLGLLEVAPVSAQHMLEEVMVTARKRTESLMEAPLSVTAVSGGNMDNQGITNLAQLASQVPGLNLGVTAQTTSIYIRGVGSGINKGFEQSAGMYVDGIYQARSRQFSLSMVDVQQVEVLRGPQSILFGKNTIAGAIKMESASPLPGDGFNGSLALDFEPDQETTRGTAVFSGDLTDSLAGRIAMRYQESDGWVDNNLRNADEKNIEDKMARGTLVWLPTENLQLTGKLAYIDMEGDGNATVNAVVDPSLLATFGQPGNSLGITQVMGSIAALQVPGYQESSGSKEFDSWVGNETFFPGGTDEDSLEYTQASLKVEWDVGDYSVTALSGYTDFDEERNQDVDFHGGNVAGNLERENLEMFSQELRIASNFDGPLNFMAGLYYEEQDGNIGRSDTVLDGTLGGVFGGLPANSLNPTLPPGLSLGDLGINSLWNGTVFASLNPAFAPLVGSELDTIVRVPDNEIDYETLAMFFEVSYDITDDLTLELGGRYSDDEKKVTKSATLGTGIPGDVTRYINADGTLTDAGAADPQNAALLGAAWGALLNTWPHDADLKREEGHFDPSVRLLWDINDDTMGYLSWSTGYKSGGFNSTSDTFNPDGTPGDGTKFGDETASAWEMGVKTSFWDQRARLSAAVFYTEIDDLQVTSFRGTTFLVGNAAEMTSQGVELDAQVALTENLEVGGAIAYLDNEFDEFSDAPCNIFQTAATAAGETCRQDLQGEAGPFAPEWSGTLYAQYDYQLGNNLLLSLRGDASYKDDFYTDADLDPNSLQESYWKYNARIALSDLGGSWEVAAYGRNLSDEATYSFTVDAPLSAGIYANGIEEPRVYGLQARYNF